MMDATFASASFFEEPLSNSAETCVLIALMTLFDENKDPAACRNGDRELEHVDHDVQQPGEEQGP